MTHSKNHHDINKSTLTHIYLVTNRKLKTIHFFQKLCKQRQRKNISPEITRLKNNPTTDKANSIFP